MKNIQIGEKAPEEFNVVIEIPMGSAVKYEIDADTGALEVDRFIGSADVYPYNYGFIPETLATDGDPLDVMLISSLPLLPEAIVAVRPVAMLEMEDEKGMDDKVICVLISEADPALSGINDLNDIDMPTQEKIKLFFKNYKEMERGKWTKVQNFVGQAKAIEAIREAMDAAKK